MEGHSAPPAAEAAGAGTTTDAAPPVQANVHAQAAHHNQPIASEEKQPIGRVTPRPTFLENLADSRESQFRFHRRKNDDFDSYFHGPRDLDKHSKWPVFLRMHGSVLPKLILPLLFVAAWSTLITLFSHYVHNRKWLGCNVRWIAG